MDEYKLIVAGTRTFTNYQLLSDTINNIIKVINRDTAIVSGMAPGADKLGYRYGLLNNIKVYEFPANWTGLGKKAGYIRNTEMGKFADALLVFWDGKSNGTKHMMDYMKQLNKPVYLIKYGIKNTNPTVTYQRKGGYECSSVGDKRFSALYAIMPDGRYLESHYQCDVKAHSPGSNNWRLGKGKPPLDTKIDLWQEYLRLWTIWTSLHPDLMDELRVKASENNNILSDCFSSTPVNQARALATILNSQ